MKRLLILVLISLFAAVPTYSQEDSPVEPIKDKTASGSLKTNQDDFQFIKAEIARLLHENRRLEAQYQALKAKLEQVKAQVGEKEREVEKISPQDWTEKRSKERKINSIKALYKDAEKLKNDIMVKNSRTAQLSTLLLDLEEKQRLWKLKRSDLEYLKRELELDIKMMEYEITERQQVRDNKITNLRKEIQDNMEREREIISRIAAIEDGTFYSPAKAAVLEQENDSLELMRLALEDEVKFAQREADILEKKKILATNSRGPTVHRKLRERQQLREEVEHLKLQVNQLSTSLDELLSRKVQRETILKDFVHIQKENEKLRTEVSDLESKLNTIGY